jgi:hypothetical protein
MSPVRYELDFISQKTAFFIVTAVKTSNYIALTGWALQRRSNVSPVRYELDFISQKTAFFIVTAVITSNLT